MQRVSRGQRTLAVAAAVCLALVVALAVHLRSADDDAQSNSRQSRVNRDSDLDGLIDRTESVGWRTKDGTKFRTDPRNDDTDADGLPDGLEAGSVVSKSGRPAVYSGFSDPTSSDTDADHVRDADEYFLAMNPRQSDSDSDDTGDADELDCGSDPLADNPDHDTYSDADECEQGSDPLGYDLTRAQQIDALVHAAGFGKDLERTAGSSALRGAQIESPAYLIGLMARDIVPFDSIRNLLPDLRDGDLVAVALDAIDIAPTSRQIRTLEGFIKHGPRAARSALAVLERAPWPRALKAKVIARFFPTSTLVRALMRDGEKTRTVYVSAPGSRERYVGITNDLARRSTQHRGAGRGFTPEPTATGVTLIAARAIEEHCIQRGGLRGEGGKLVNDRHSISPRHPGYDELVRAGAALLKKQNGRCPI